MALTNEKDLQAAEALAKALKISAENAQNLFKAIKASGGSIASLLESSTKLTKTTATIAKGESRKLVSVNKQLEAVEAQVKQISLLQRAEKNIIKGEREKAAIYNKVLVLKKKDKPLTLSKARNEVKFLKESLQDKIKALKTEASLENKNIRNKIKLEKEAAKAKEAFRKKYGWGAIEDTDRKRETAAHKGLGRTTGELAGELDDAVSSFMKPFQNKSLNPLKWLKGGAEAAGDMEKARNTMITWAIGLDKAVAQRNMAAGTEEDLREKEAGAAGTEEDLREKEAGAEGENGKSKRSRKSKATAEGENGKSKRSRKSKATAGEKKDIQKGVNETLSKTIKDGGKKGIKGKAGNDLNKGLFGSIGKTFKSATASVRDSFGKAFGKEAVPVGKLSKDVVDENKRRSGFGLRPGKSGAAPDLGSFKKATSGLKMMLTVVRALSLALNVLSKATWIFAIIGAISAVVNKLADLDVYMKGLNKTFLKMAGPTVGVKGVAKDMGKFNDAIHDMSRNIKLGLKPEEIQEMFKAVAGAGMAPQVLAGKAGGYAAVIQGVRKTNIELGVSYEEAGKMIGDQMVNLQGSFDDTRGSLQQLGYNAMKAGINTDKFYAAIEGSISSLSYFGNYTKTASASLTSFINQGTLGFKDAASAANSYLSVFEKMGWKDLQKVFAVTGGGNMSGEGAKNHPLVKIMSAENDKLVQNLNALQAKRQGKAVELDKQTAVDKIDPELRKEIAGLDKEIAMLANRTDNFAKGVEDFAKTGTVGMLAQSKELLTGHLAETIQAVKDSSGTNEYKAAQIESLKSIMGLSEEFIRQMDTLTNSIEKTNTDLVSGFSSMTGKFDKNIGIKLEELVTAADKNRGDSGALLDIQESIYEVSRKNFQEGAEGEKQARRFAKSMVDSTEMGPEMTGKLMKVIQAISSGDTRSLDLIAKDAGMNKKQTAQTADILNKSGRADKAGLSNLDDQQAELIRKTTSAKDYWDIAKASTDYYLAKGAAGATESMLLVVKGIAGDVALMASDKKEQYNQKKEKVANASTVGSRQWGSNSTLKKYKNVKEFLVAASENEIELEKLKKSGDEKDKEKIKDLEKKKKAFDKDMKTVKKYARGGFWEAVFLGRSGARVKKEELERTFGEIAEQGKQENVMKATAGGTDAAATDDTKQLPDAKKAGGMTVEQYKAERDAAIANNKGKEWNAAHPYASEPITDKNGNPVKDGKVHKRGQAFLSDGDYVVNPAVIKRGQAGEFLTEVLKNMGIFDAPMTKGSNLQGQGIQINLGGIKVLGDIEDPNTVMSAGRKIVDMIEQVVIKYDKQMSTSKH